MIFKPLHLEMSITRLCNLHCDGCDQYANYTRTEAVPLDEGIESLRLWSARLQPQGFVLLGGEPALHPDLIGYVLATREIWPHTNLRIICNGTQLKRHPELPRVLADTNTTLQVSFHSDHPRYMEMMKGTLRLVKMWERDYGINLVIEDNRRFFRQYRGIGKDMLPYSDGQPEKSWGICVGRNCLNIYQGRLWKCSPITFLRDVLKKFDLQDHPAWLPYLRYDGLGIDCSDEDLAALAGPEEICGMCPSRLQKQYRKDVFNIDFDQPSLNYVEWSGPEVDLEEFLAQFDGPLVEAGSRDSRNSPDPFDEAFYLSNYPDVADAVVRGEFPTGRDHWEKHGIKEGRIAKRERVSEP